MAYTNNWADDVPIDHTKFKAVTGAIRTARIDIEDRLKNILYGFIAGETQTDEGVKNLPFRAQGGDPGATANKVKIYSKTFDSGSGAKAELFMEDEAANIMQLTAGGKWVGGGYKEIKMTAGTIAQLATKWPGWALCNGSNGTPDLRDKFIVGATSDDSGAAKSNVEGALHQSGGANTHQHGGSTAGHALTADENGPHQHDIPSRTLTVSGAQDKTRVSSGQTNPDEVLALKVASSGLGTQHLHGVSADNNIPIYFALVFIMKL